MMMAKHTLFIAIAFCSSPLWADSLCGGASSNTREIVAKSLAKYEAAFENQFKPMFFVGMLSRIENRERRRLSTVLSLKSDSEMIQGLREVMNTLSARLAEDRRELAAWVSAQKLSDEIEVVPIPVEGTFLLVKATRIGVQAMLCASAQGALPALLTELSH
jgi:hypothetical protein